MAQEGIGKEAEIVHNLLWLLFFKLSNMHDFIVSIPGTWKILTLFWNDVFFNKQTKNYQCNYEPVFSYLLGVLFYTSLESSLTHSSTLAWKIPWTEEPGRLQSMGSQRVGHDWATSLHFTSLHLESSFRFRQRCYCITVVPT